MKPLVDAQRDLSAAWRDVTRTVGEALLADPLVRRLLRLLEKNP